MSLLIDVTSIAYQWSKESLFPQLKEHCKQMIVFPWNTQIYNTMLQHTIFFTLKWKNNSVLVLILMFICKWIICVHQHHIGCIALLLFTNFQKNCCLDFWLVKLSDYWLGVSPSAFSFFNDVYAILVYFTGDQEIQNLLIYITDHLNKRGRVLVCGGIQTSANLESSLLFYPFIKEQSLVSAVGSSFSFSHSVHVAPSIIWWSVDLRSERILSQKREIYWGWNNGFYLFLL